MKIFNNIGRNRMYIFLLFAFPMIMPLVAQNTTTSNLDEKGQAEKSVLLSSEQAEATSVQSASVVQGDKLLHRPTFQMEQYLDGTLPGLFVDMSQGYPTEKSALRMRGRNLLIVVDGIPRSDANIPASQIESVTLLKDALGLAAWGMSSGDGVLFIKTKRGNASKLTIDFTAQRAIAEQIFRPQFLDAYSYANLLNQGLVNDGSKPLYSEQDLEAYRSKSNPYTHPDVDWYSVLMRDNSPIQQYNMNISGGAKTAKYFIDLNMYDQDGFLKQDNSINKYNTRESFKKYSMRTNVDVQLFPTTSLSVNVFGQMFKENTPGKTMMGSIYNALHTTPNNAYAITNPLADLNGDGIPDKTYAGNSNYTNNLYAQSIESGYIMYPKTDFNFDLILEHHFTNKLEGFYLKGLYSYNSSYREMMSRTKGYEIWQYKPLADLEPNDPKNYNKILSASAPDRSSSYNRQNRMQYIEAAAGYDFDVDQHSLKSRLTFWNNEYILQTTDLPMLKSGFNLHSEYNFDKRYLAEISMSSMSLNYLSPSKRWGYFPAIGLGWNVHQEEFFNVAKIDMLKLRTTIGISGNDGTGAFFRSGTGGLSDYYYPYVKLYSAGANVNLGQTNIGHNTLIENGIPYDPTYEKSRRFTFGADVYAFERVLRASIEYFNNYHYDILTTNVAKSLNSMMGVKAPMENIGAHLQHGVEMDVEYTKQFGEFSINANVQATLYKTKLISNGEPTYPEAYMQRVGQPNGMIFGYVADGFFQSQDEIKSYMQSYSLDGYSPKPGDLKYKDLNGDHLIDRLDITAIGTKAPRIEYGFYLNTGWKGIALSTQWTGVTNVQTTLMDMPFKINSSNSYGQAMKEHLDYWRPDNTDASYPRISAAGNSYNERTSTFWIKDINFLRLKNIELSYTLPQKWSSAIQLSNVKFFANAYNALTVTPLKNRDPELLRYVSGAMGVVPNFKAFNAGINVQF